VIMSKAVFATTQPTLLVASLNSSRVKMILILLNGRLGTVFHLADIIITFLLAQRTRDARQDPYVAIKIDGHPVDQVTGWNARLGG
jgi:hypothetical protein